MQQKKKQEKQVHCVEQIIIGMNTLVLTARKKHDQKTTRPDALHMIINVDRSGSMSTLINGKKSRLDGCKFLLSSLLKQRITNGNKEQDTLCLKMFDHEVTQVFDGMLRDFDFQAFQGVFTRGMTNFEKILSSTTVTQQQQKGQVIEIFLTDGECNEGITNHEELSKIKMKNVYGAKDYTFFGFGISSDSKMGVIKCICEKLGDDKSMFRQVNDDEFEEFAGEIGMIAGMTSNMTNHEIKYKNDQVSTVRLINDVTRVVRLEHELLDTNDIINCSEGGEFLDELHKLNDCNNLKELIIGSDDEKNKKNKKEDADGSKMVLSRLVTDVVEKEQLEKLKKEQLEKLKNFIDDLKIRVEDTKSKYNDNTYLALAIDAMVPIVMKKLDAVELDIMQIPSPIDLGLLRTMSSQSKRVRQLSDQYTQDYTTYAEEDDDDEHVVKINKKRPCHGCNAYLPSSLWQDGDNVLPPPMPPLGLLRRN